MRRISARTAVYPEVAGMLQNGELLAVTVTGSCMAPLLREGQRLMLQKQTRYSTGDILVFAATGGELLVHRYLGPAPGARVMTKADTGRGIDVLVLRNQVLGRVLTADGVVIAVNAGRRARTALQYLGWVTKLVVSRVLARR